MKKICNLLFYRLMIKCFLLLTAYSLLPTLLFAQSGWSEDMRLTYFWGYSYDPRAACCGDTVHLVWWEHYGVNGNLREEVFYKRSTDAGYAWEDDVRLTPEDEITAVTPCIAVWGKNVHVVWKEQGAYYSAICYRKSEDGGDTWGITDTILQTNFDGWYHPWITVNSNNVYIVSIKSGSGGQLVFVKSTDNGNSWLPSQEITRATSQPRIDNSKIDSCFLTTVYQISGEIYNIGSSDAGEVWGDSQVVSENDGVGSQWPAMDMDDSCCIYITWFDYKYSPYPWTGDIFYRASRDSGNTWEEIDSLTAEHRAVASDILAENTNLHLVWEDDRNDFGENFEIYYRMSTNLGLSWGPEVRLTDTLNWSRFPSLACNDNYLHLFWSDQRDDPVNKTDEIYYKRKNLFGIKETKNTKFNSVCLSLKCPTILTRREQIFYDLNENKGGEVLIIEATGSVSDRLPVYQSSGYFTLDINREVQNGVYFIMLRAGSESVIKKVIKVE